MAMTKQNNWLRATKKLLFVGCLGAIVGGAFTNILPFLITAALAKFYPDADIGSPIFLFMLLGAISWKSGALSGGIVGALFGLFLAASRHENSENEAPLAKP